MNDTPETDQELECCGRGVYASGLNLIELCRKLERERDEARAMARDQRNQLEKASPARLLYQWEIITPANPAK
jgi:hypothetical protein